MMWDVHAQPAILSSTGADARPRRLGLAGDERLARLVGSGSDGAFAALYARHHQAIYRYCRSLTGNDADGQDALQSTFISALVALRDGRRDAPLRPWLFRIAHNESISLLRKRRPEQELPDDGGPTTRGPAEVLEERERLASLVADLMELPERQRGALVMRELSGLAHEEVAVALGISVGAAKQTVLEARKTLHEFSEGRAMPCNQIERMVSDGDRRALRARRVRAHLRTCAHCATFAAAIDQRRSDLMVIAPPLPAVAAAGLLSHVFGGAAGAGSGSTAAGAGGAGVAAGAAGKGIGATLSAKGLMTGAAIVAATAVGATAVHRLTSHPARPGDATHAPAAGAAHRAAGHLRSGTARRAGSTTHGTKTRTHGARTGTASHARPHRGHGTTAGVPAALTHTGPGVTPAVGSSPALHSHRQPAAAALNGTKTRSHGSPVHRRSARTHTHPSTTAHTHGRGKGTVTATHPSKPAPGTTTTSTDATPITGGGSGKPHAIAK